MLFATYRAARAIDTFLVEQQPSVANLPESRRKREMERLRGRFQKDAGYLNLVKQQQAAQARLEEAYPQLFVTDEQINASRKIRRDQLRNDSDFQKANHERAAVWRAQQEYLVSHDSTVIDIQQQMNSTKDSK